MMKMMPGGWLVRVVILNSLRLLPSPSATFKAPTLLTNISIGLEFKWKQKGELGKRN